MTTVRKRGIKTDEEQKLLIGLIVSTPFCQKVLSIIEPAYLQMPQSTIVLRWIKNYFERYKQAPKGQIKDIFEAERPQLKEAEVTQRSPPAERDRWNH